MDLKLWVIELKQPNQKEEQEQEQEQEETYDQILMTPLEENYQNRIMEMLFIIIITIDIIQLLYIIL